MKTNVTLLLALATLTLGALSFYQWRKLDEQQSRIIALQDDRAQTEQQLAELQLANERAEEQQRELLRLLSQPAAAPPPKPVEPQTLQTSGGEPPAPAAKRGQESGGMGKFLSQLMEDPDTKKLIYQQQRMMMDQLYGPLIKQMGLTPEEAERFKNMLADDMMRGTERASALLGGSESDRKELLSQMAAEQKSSEEKIQEFLGDGLFAQYKEYQQTLAERTQLNMLRQQSAGSEHPLSDAQTEQLLLLMSEEKRNVAAATGKPFPGVNQSSDQFEAMLSEDRAEALFQAQESVNQRVFERAKEILSPEQLQGFSKFQNDQLQMMRMGVSMARKFMGPDQPESGPPPPAP
jgi:hypothetical protein